MLRAYNVPYIYIHYNTQTIAVDTISFYTGKSEALSVFWQGWLSELLLSIIARNQGHFVNLIKTIVLIPLYLIFKTSL